MRIEDMQCFLTEFEEELLIDRPVSIGGRQLYLLAACRKEKKITLYLLAEHPGKEAERVREEKIWEKQRKETLNRREEILARLQTSDHLMNEIEGVKTPQGEFEVCSMCAGGFEFYNAEGFMMLSHFLEQGISAEEVKETDLSEMDYIAMELQGEFEKIPFSSDGLTLLYHPRGYSVWVKKKMKLEIGKEYPRKYRFYCEELKRNIEFYINKVSLYDSWSEIQEVKKHMVFWQDASQEQKEDVIRQMEEICPKGMYHLVIEYECEDGNLDFYTKDQLKEKVAARSSACACGIFLGGYKKEGPEYGPHGLKHRSCIIQYPIAGDVTEVETELLTARINGRSETVSSEVICTYTPQNADHMG